MADAKRGLRALIDETWWRLTMLTISALVIYSSLLFGPSDFLYEDAFPKGVAGWSEARLPYVIWGFIPSTDPAVYHALNLGVHAITSLMVGLVAWRIWRSPDTAWAAGSLFWLHPLAIPAVGYAQALPEMLVGLGAVTVTWCLLQRRTWWWIGSAAVVLLVTVNVKESAIGVLLIPVVTLILRPIRWRLSGGWVAIGIFLLYLVGVDASVRAVQQELHGYPWNLWPEEMAPMTTQATLFFVQSIVPVGIAFQTDPTAPILAVPCVIVGLCWGIWLWRDRRHNPAPLFAFAYILAIIGIRLVWPTSNWPDRAPEMLYAQQWYPALPAVLWGLVALGGDASPAAPSAA